MNTSIQERHEKAMQIVSDAARLALNYFHDIEALHIENKGVQDFVSNADKAVELAIREQLQQAYANDGIIGEEHDNIESSSGYTWVIDPIDGTSSFVVGMPGWAVVLACIKDGQAVIGIVKDPVANETFSAIKGQGTTLNGRAISVSQATRFDQGSTGVGYSNRTDIQQTQKVLDGLMQESGIFYRCGSGAIMLCYVAAGRLIAYCEPHMYSWDCVAALLIISEAGGRHYPYQMDEMLSSGACIITAGEALYPQLQSLCLDAYQMQA